MQSTIVAAADHGQPGKQLFAKMRMFTGSNFLGIYLSYRFFLRQVPAEVVTQQAGIPYILGKHSLQVNGTS